MARSRERPTSCSPDDTLSWVESRTGQGEEGTSEPGSNDLDGGGDDNSDGQDEEESGSERKQIPSPPLILPLRCFSSNFKCQ